MTRIREEEDKGQGAGKSEKGSQPAPSTSMEPISSTEESQVKRRKRRSIRRNEAGSGGDGQVS